MENRILKNNFWGATLRITLNAVVFLMTAAICFALFSSCGEDEFTKTDEEFVINVGESGNWTPFSGETNVTFTNSNDAVIFIAPSGSTVTFTGLKGGNSIISATSGDKKATAMVIVKDGSGGGGSNPNPINEWECLFVYGTLEFEIIETESSLNYHSNTKCTFSSPIVLSLDYKMIYVYTKYPDMVNTLNNGIMPMAAGFSVVDPDYATHKNSTNRDYGAFINSVVAKKEHFAVADYTYSRTGSSGDCTISESGKISTNKYTVVNAVFLHKVFKVPNKIDYGYKLFFQYGHWTNTEYVHVTGCGSDDYIDQFILVEEGIFGGSPLLDNGGGNPEYGFDINKSDMDSFIKNPKGTLEIPFEGKITLYEGRNQTIKGTLRFN